MSNAAKHLADFREFTFDFSERVLRRRDAIIHLPPRTITILEYLIRNRDRRISQTELMAQCWPGVTVSVDSIHRQIADIRRALSDTPQNSRYIRTVYKLGWQFIAPVIERIEVVASSNSGLPKAEAASDVFRRQIRPTSLVLKAVAIAAVAFGLWTVKGPPKLRSVQTRRLTMDGRPKVGPLITDGKLIYFREKFGAHWRTVSLSIMGGDPVPLGPPFSDQAPVWISADGKNLALTSFDGTRSKLWFYSGSSRQLSLMKSDVDSAAVSPDGKEVAISAGTVLSISDPNGATIAKTELPGYPSHLRWAPNGQMLRFSLPAFVNSASSAEWEFHLKERLARNLPRISDGNGYVGAGTWSVNGRLFFYEAGSAPNRDIWVTRELPFGATESIRLTRSEPGSWGWPSADPNDESAVLAIYRYAGSELTRFNIESRTWEAESGTAAYETSYSPDQQWAAYTLLSDHTIWKAGVNGGGLVRLTSPGREAHQPHWAPDGKMIGYMGQNAAGKWRAFQVSANGGTPQELWPDGEDQGVPTWSRDGRFVIWGERLSQKPRSKMAIHVLDLRAKTLTEMPGTEGLWSPRWSPTGDSILAITTDSHELRVLTSKGSEWRELVKMRNVDNATWSVDSRFIYFNGRPDGSGWSIYRVGALTGSVERIVSLDGFESPEENWFGVSIDGSPLALHAVPLEEIFKLKASF